MKIGIFGGSFNPPHNAHVLSAQTVAKKLGLQKVYVVPTYRNPLKALTDGPTPEQRLEMTKLAFAQYGESFFVDDQEVRREDKSYTIDTIRHYRKTHAAQELYLILGADKFEELNKWKEWQSLISETNLIITTRPGYPLPQAKEELPQFLIEHVEDYDFSLVQLKSGRTIEFITLRDVDISSTELRKALRKGMPVEKHIPLAVENYIRDQKLYRNLGDRIGDYRKFTSFCSKVLFNKKGIAVKGFDITALAAPSEYTLIASGTSTRHTAAMAENLIHAVKQEYNVHPQSVEGLDEGRWVLLDYGSLIIHLFYDFVRQEYDLERMWKDGKDLGLKDPALKRIEQMK